MHLSHSTKRSSSSSCCLDYEVCLHILHPAKDIILSTIQMALVSIAANNFVMVSKSLEEQIEHVSKGCAILLCTSLTNGLKMYALFSNTEMYLGYILGPGQLAAV